MKKIIIYFFSGTGNTKLVAELYQKYFSAANFEVTLFQIKMADGKFVVAPNSNDFDIIGFGFPIYGFNSPLPAFNFAKALPQIAGEKKSTFLFRTGGEGTSFNNYASQKIIRVLLKKNYDILTDRLFVMPYNMVFRHSPQMVKSEYIYANAIVRLNVQEIQNGSRQKIKYFPLRYWFVPIVRIVWAYGKFQGRFVLKVNKEKCGECNSCVKNCPMGNIRFDKEKGKYVFGWNCALCVACSFGCPKDAISIGILNPWRVNGSYNIEKTAGDPSIVFPHFGENLKGLMRFLYYKYYKKCDEELRAGGISLIEN